MSALCSPRWLITVGALASAVALAQAPRRVTVENLSPGRERLLHVDTLWHVGDRPNEPLATTFQSVGNIQIDSLGQVLVADYRACTIRVLSATGAYVSSIGRAGDGPGEFRLPTAISVAPGGGVYVYDSGPGVVTEFTREFRYVRVIRPERRLSNVRGLIVTRNRIYLSGVSQDSALRGKVIHTFAFDGRYLFSFGTLPPAAAPEVSYLLGAGAITPARDGGIWYSQPAPYSLRKYSSTGALTIQIERPNSFLPVGDSAYSMVLNQGRVTTTTRPYASAIRVREMGDGSLINQTRMADDRIVTDFYSPALALTHSVLGIPALGAPIGSDRFASLIYTDAGPAVALLRPRLQR